MRIGIGALLLGLVAACSATNDDGDVTGDDDNLTEGMCVAMPTCDGAGGPALGDKRGFDHFGSKVTATLGDPNHRGRDEIFAIGGAQTITGKFAYGLNDKDLEDEEVEVWAERGCKGAWDKLGTAKTNDDGRISFDVPKEKTLRGGRHRLRLVVAGDHTSTDLLVDVVPQHTKILVSDVDGTLTSSETAEFPALLVGELPGAQPDAANVLSALAEKGYHPVYITARAERLNDRTHEFLKTKGFPRGIVHTTNTALGETGDAAAKYKSGELAAIEQKQLTIAWAFGNQPSDTDAYDAAHIEPVDHRVFLKVTDAHGGRRIEKYADVLPDAKNAAPACK
jgi:phosphatidate phosphatase PAH1